MEWKNQSDSYLREKKTEVYLKHFYDSIAYVLQGLIDNQELAAGYRCWSASLPYESIYPQLDVTIIDSQ